jgi:hypothetical protein
VVRFCNSADEVKIISLRSLGFSDGFIAKRLGIKYVEVIQKIQRLRARYLGA